VPQRATTRLTDGESNCSIRINATAATAADACHPVRGCAMAPVVAASLFPDFLQRFLPIPITSNCENGLQHH
jgi:hypothetical protein